MLLYLSGSDTFRSRQQLKLMIEKFKKDRDPQGYNVARVECEREEAGKIMEQILATPFLAERRMVVLENLLVSKHKDLQEELLKRVEEKSLPESNIIVFWEGTDTFKAKSAKVLAERLAKEKFAQKFDLLKGVALGNWIANEVKERGGTIGADAVRYLAEHTGGDMWRLNSLIDQLVAYRNVSKAADIVISTEAPQGEVEKSVGEGIVASESVSYSIAHTSTDPSTALRSARDDKKTASHIQLPDVQLFLDEKADDNIFNLVDAIVAKQSKQVYRMIQEQYRKGEDVQFIFAMLLRQFRILLEMRDLFEREDMIQSQALAQKLKLHPFVVRKSLPLVRRYTMEQLKTIYNELLELDLGIKTSRGRPEVLLDVFVGRVTQSSPVRLSSR